MSSLPSYRPPHGAVSVTVNATYEVSHQRLSALAGATMGTTWSARLNLPTGVTQTQAQQAIQNAVDLIVAQMSTWESDSSISRYNQATTGWHAVPEEFFHVLEYSLNLATQTQGAYDPTIGPLVNAWGFGPHQRAFEPPSPQTLQIESQRCGWHRLRLNPIERQVWQPGGVYLDLSSVAKGHGVDFAGQALERLGVHNYLLEIGGELRARGHRPDGQAWRVAVEVPDASDDHVLSIALQDRSIATSGDYRRYADSAQGRYAHTIDPRSGRPIDNQIASVSVVHAGCMQADALATALTVLGAQAGLDFARQHALAVLFIVRKPQGFTLLASPEFQALCHPA